METLSSSCLIYFLFDQKTRFWKYFASADRHYHYFASADRHRIKKGYSMHAITIKLVVVEVP
jgi:hypothetical protein